MSLYTLAERGESHTEVAILGTEGSVGQKTGVGVEAEEAQGGMRVHVASFQKKWDL